MQPTDGDPKSEDGSLGTLGHGEQTKREHDLLNILSAILIHSQLLSHYSETEDRDGEAIRKSAASIAESVKEMLKLIDTLF